MKSIFALLLCLSLACCLLCSCSVVEVAPVVPEDALSASSSSALLQAPIYEETAAGVRYTLQLEETARDSFDFFAPRIGFHFGKAAGCFWVKGQRKYTRPADCCTGAYSHG